MRKKWMIALVLSLIFVMEILFFYATARINTRYEVGGKMVTIPDYNKNVESSDPWTRSLYRLMGWDGHWYYHIGEHGYRSTWPPTAQSPDESNVAFFPFHPKIAKLISEITGIPLEFCLLLLSQLSYLGIFAVFLWYYLQVIGEDLLGYLPLVPFLAFPGAFFFVTAYSESFFTLSLLSYMLATVYFLKKPTLGLGILAVLTGILMNGTRLAGLTVTGFPLLIWTLQRFSMSGESSARVRGIGWPLVLTLGSILGLLGFLVYCAIQFDHWNIYYETVKIGWHAGRDDLSYLMPFMPWILVKNIIDTRSPFLLIDNILLLFVYSMIAFEFFRNLTKFFKKQEVSVQMATITIGAFTFYQILITPIMVGAPGSIRYTLPVISILLLYWPMVYKRFSKWTKGTVAIALLIATYYFMGWQKFLFTYFISGYFVG